MRGRVRACAGVRGRACAGVCARAGGSRKRARSTRRDIYGRLIYIGADGRGVCIYMDDQREQGGRGFFGRVGGADYRGERGGVVLFVDLWYY